MGIIQCRKCKIDKTRDDYWPSTLKAGIAVLCKDCRRANRRAKTASKQSEKFCPRCSKSIGKGGNQQYCSRLCLLRAFQNRVKYGLTSDGDIILFNAQNGICPACREPLGEDYSKMHIDHCHDTGKVRGLLHGWCNKSLQDDPELAFWQQVYIAGSTFDLRELCVGYGC